MRVAAIYDIHGNLPALEAALSAIDDAGVDLIVVGGDLAGGPLPRDYDGAATRIRAKPGPVAEQFAERVLAPPLASTAVERWG